MDDRELSAIRHDIYELKSDLRREICDDLRDIKQELATGIGYALSNAKSEGFLTFINTILLGVLLWRVW